MEILNFIVSNLWIFWLIVFVLTLVIEFITNDITSIWFSLGSLVALITSLIPGVQWWVTVVLFAVLSFASFFFIKPMLARIIKRDQVPSNIDEIKGKRGVMTKEYNDTQNGEVKVNGVLWTAINSDDNKTLPEGSKVEVLSVIGNKLIVREIKEDK